MRQRLAYLHLPKSAGTSIRSALTTYYDSADTVPWSFDPLLFGHDERLPEVTEPVFLGRLDELQGYRYMEGHFGLPMIRSAFDVADIATILREPRSRLLSHYVFWRGWPEWMHDLWEPYDGAKYARCTLSEFCTEPRIAHQADNLITRLIVGDHPLVPLDGHIAATDIDAVAAEACRRLDELGFVDVLERGDAVYEAFEAWFGSPLERAHLNATDHDRGEPVDIDDLLGSRTMALLHDRSAADLQLWHHVAERRGVVGTDARSLADGAFASGLATIVGRHTRIRYDVEVRAEIERATRETILAEIADRDRREADLRAAMVPRPAAPVRLIRLVRRGPRAIWQRVLAEVTTRRGRRLPEP